VLVDIGKIKFALLLVVEKKPERHLKEKICFKVEVPSNMEHAVMIKSSNIPVI
jgi:hypothetical protein